MSVIAVQVTEHELAIAVDSLTSYGEPGVNRGIHLADAKMWATGAGVIIAFTGISSIAAVLRRWSSQHTPDGTDENAICAYVDAFNVWRRADYPDAGEIDGLAFVLAFGGRVWVIDGYSVSEVPVEGYMAHGSGMPVALGAMHAGATAINAVRAACLHQNDCGLPVVHARMTKDGAIAGNLERFGEPRTLEVVKEAA